ncbi:MAG: TrbI/VirB10 family protein, partial [Hyphomicrobiales bacterium]
MREKETAAQSMRLRADPPRVTRLSRRVLAGIGFLASLGIGGALIYALQTRDSGGRGEELYSTSNRQPADGLASLPRDYTGPILGPPLPGDLGRPMLDAQNKDQPVVPPTIATPTVDEAEQRRLTEEEAARTSRVFFQTGAVTAAAPEGPSNSAAPELAGSDIAGGQTAQDRQLAFLNGAADRQTVAPDRVMPPASPYVLQAGAVIPAALITGIRSDLPGQISAQVTENVYDSPTGRALLIPQGTRVIGQYDSGVGFGQRRVLLVWNRLIFPDGRSIVLERQPGAVAQGYAGLEDG